MDSKITKYFKIEDFKNIKDVNDIESKIHKINQVYYTDFSESRNETLKTLIMDLIKIIDENLQNSNILSKNEIAYLYFLKSLSLDRLPDYSKQAEESASKSLKLNPFNADNYNCMAHILWKKKDIEGAINYFQKSLDIDPKNKSTYRSLSMIMRSKEYTDEQERKLKADESLDLAKKAINIDLTDSESWYIYGNAFFYHAFCSQNQYEDLLQALKSYRLSEKYQNSYKNPDLYYNRGMVFIYLENYSDAFKDLLVSHEIDKSLKANIHADNIITMITNTSKLIKFQCSIKSKKLYKLLDSIPVSLNEKSGYTLKDVNSLNEGVNSKILVSAKIFQVMEKAFEVPLSLICCDHKGNFFVTSLYNTNKSIIEKIKMATSNIAVVDPQLLKISMKIGDKENEYCALQVSDLSKVLIDGKYCANYSSNSQLNSTFFN